MRATSIPSPPPGNPPPPPNSTPPPPPSTYAGLLDGRRLATSEAQKANERRELEIRPATEPDDAPPPPREA
eukprot:12002680-Alexandrium_andersonii.AAC.1